MAAVRRHARGPRSLILRVTVPALTVVLGSAFAWHLFDGARRGLVRLGETDYAILADDMMISLRYAWHLAHGHGLVWNPGERVQGITNLGWTLLAALPYALGASLERGPLVVSLVNAGLHAALAGGLALWAWRAGRPLQSVLVGLVVALSGPIAFWGMSGFETTAQAMLVTAACLPWLGPSRGRSWTPVWAALATVIRPDSLLVFMVILVLALHEAWRRGRPGRLGPAAVALAIVSATFLGQRLYYGAWLPNTFALKATGGAATLGRGLEYLERFAWSEAAGLALLAGPALALAWQWTSQQPCPVPLLTIAGLPYLWVAYLVWVGGDAFPLARFFIPMIPLLAVFCGDLGHELAQTVSRAMRERRPLRAGAAGLAFAVLIGGIGLHVRATAPGRREVWSPQADWVSAACIALAIRDMRPAAGTVIGVYYAGVTPYLLPEYRAHDFLGKSDHVIARGRAHRGAPGHNKWDYAYSLGVVRPDLIVTAGPFLDGERISAADVEGDNGFHPGLWLDPVFRAEYRPHRLLPAPGESHPYQWVYRRADFTPERPFALPAGCR